MDKIKLLKALLCEDEICGKSELPFAIGDKVFLRTVTHHLTGRVKEIVGKFLILSEAAWIADNGRFMQFIQDGKLNEVEPVTCDVKVNTDSLIDAYEWRHELPREQK